MRLVLMRHATAAPGVSDFERPLAARGEQQLQQAARALARMDLGIARVLASPALRCRRSAEVVAAALGVAAVEVAPELALDAAADAALARLLDRDAATLAVGHAPDLGAAAAVLLGGAVLWLDCGGAAALEVDRSGRRAALAWLLPASVLAELGRG